MTAPSHTASVRRLRPGAPVLRRDADSLQVGLDAPTRVVLPDTPPVRGLLARLRTGCTRPTSGAGEAAAWERLEAAALLVPGPDRAGDVDAPAPGALAATAAWAGPDAARRLRARRTTRVRLHGPLALVEPVRRLAAAGGLDTGTGGAGDARTALSVLLHDGEAHRDTADALVSAGCAHLPVWWRCGLPHIGPLVVPGVTACLRCVDAHEGEADPRRALLLEQAAREHAPPPDPVLLALASAWLVRDLQRWAEGDPPTTYSSTVRLTADALPVLTPRTRHPHCGCSWGDPLTA